MVAARLVPFFQSLENREGDAILFITHAVTMRLIRAILEQTLPKYPERIAKNGEIWKMGFVGYGKIRRIESLFLETAGQAFSRA